MVLQKGSVAPIILLALAVIIAGGIVYFFVLPKPPLLENNQDTQVNPVNPTPEQNQNDNQNESENENPAQDQPEENENDLIEDNPNENTGSVDDSTVCGNGSCEQTENCFLCSQDCGNCPNSSCVNNDGECFQSCASGFEVFAQGNSECSLIGEVCCKEIILTPVCGNNAVESPESCDGANLNGNSCQSRGFTSGTLSCKSDCSDFETSQCTESSENAIEPSEDIIFVDSSLSHNCFNETYSLANRDCSAFEDTGFTGFTTIQEAIDTVSSGEIVYVRQGTYTSDDDEWVVKVLKVDDPNEPFPDQITLSAYGNEVPLIDVEQKKWGFYVEETDNITIKGFEIANGKRAGIYLIDSSNVIIEKNKIHDFRDTSTVNIVVAGIRLVDKSNSNIVRFNEVYNSSGGISIRSDQGEYAMDNLVEKNYVHDIFWINASGAYDNKNADCAVSNHTYNNTFRRNVFARCGDDGLDVYNSVSNLIEQNIVFNTGDGISGFPVNANGDGGGIKSSTGGGGGHVFRYNISFNNEVRGFDQSHIEASAPGNIYFNNVAFGNGENGFFIEKDSASPTILKNNISFMNNQQNNSYKDIRVKTDAPIISENNFWADGNFPYTNNDLVEVNSLSGNPLFVSAPQAGIMVSAQQIGLNLDFESPEFGLINGFKLQANSPAINAGQDVGLNFSGSKPDLGAYESN